MTVFPKPFGYLELLRATATHVEAVDRNAPQVLQVLSEEQIAAIRTKGGVSLVWTPERGLVRRSEREQLALFDEEQEAG